MSFKQATVVEVHAFGRLVGAVTHNPSFRNSYAFEYTPQWRASGIQLAPLLMPSNQKSVWTFANLNEQTYYGLPPMIADSLPDKFGNALVDAYLASQAIPRSQITALDRLAYLGARGMGALEFRPAQHPNTRQPSIIQMSQLVQAARALISGTIESEEAANQVLGQILQVGTSAGGARAKAIVDFNPATLQLKAGRPAHTAGFEKWLIKFDGVGRDNQLGNTAEYGRIEYAYSLMAKASGIEMTETRLLEENGRSHFMTKRFDRTELGGKLHMQSLCALDQVDFNLVKTNAYEQLFNAIVALGLGQAALDQAWTRMVFNVLASNCDDHSKNFSFLMDSAGVWRLAPAYDVTFAYDPNNHWINSHLMSVRGKFANIKPNDLYEVADIYGIASAKRRLTEIRDVVANWQHFATDAGVSPASIAEIGPHLNQIF